jgi:hypothetical protein
VLLALVTTLSIPATAQVSSDTTKQPSSPRIYFAGGVELGPGIFVPGLRRGELSLEAGYTRRVSRLGLRLGLGYYERTSEYGPTSTRDGTFAFPHVLSESRTIAANLDVTYDLTRTRIRPYVVGGVGLYQSRVSTSYDGSPRGTFSAFGGALKPGLGLRFPLRNTQAFTELRFHMFPGHSRVVLPLTFGIQF